MALYQDRLKRKKKWDDFKFNATIGLRLYWNSLTYHTATSKMFHEVIIEDIHTALEHGSKEIRYYKTSDNGKYESLQDEYDNFAKSSVDKELIGKSVRFFKVMELVKAAFDEYEDLEFIFIKDYGNPAFGIKTKF